MRVENVWLFVSLLARNTTVLVLQGLPDAPGRTEGVFGGPVSCDHTEPAPMGVTHHL